MRVPTLVDIVAKFKVVMVAKHGHSVQQIMRAPRGTVVKVTIEVLGERFRFDGKRYSKKSLPGHSGQFREYLIPRSAKSCRMTIN